MVSKRKNSGFTLLELLIAISIFSFLATGCYRLFSSVTKTYETTSRLWQENNAIQRALLVMNKDFSQIAPRPIRNDFGDREMAFVASDGEVVFTRGGWRNFLNEPRSNLQRIGYRLEGGQLLRRSWPTLDRAPESEYSEQVLLDNVQDFTITFLDSRKVWHKSWPPESENQSERFVQIPAAMAYTIIHEGQGEISQLVPGSSYAPNDNFSSSSAGGASGDDDNDNGNNSNDPNAQGGQ